MDIYGKWIKALVGLKKLKKLPSSVKDENKSAGSKVHRRKHSVEIEDSFRAEFYCNSAAHVEEPNSTTVIGTPGSFQVQEASHSQQTLRAERAATRIQTTFRGFLARRALRALKGLVWLQALVRGHAVRKQAAITLRCMQALVRVQAHVRARCVRLALESEATQEKFQQQLANDAGVCEIEEGWCDSIGSVEDIQAKLLKQQEAAAKRNRAMAYALAHQASSRQQAKPAGFEPDKNSWGWNWLERWMAVRPREDRFLDINLWEDVMIWEKGPSGSYYSGTRPSAKASGKKLVSVTVSAPKMGPPHSDGCSFSPGELGTTLEENPSAHDKPPCDDNVAEEVRFRPGIGLRSNSNPKEMSTQSDKLVKKRLSLSNTGGGGGSRAAQAQGRTSVRGTLSSQRTTIKERPKISAGDNINPSKSVKQFV